jgi:aerobic C4-dicarboxylate transport protein
MASGYHRRSGLPPATEGNEKHKRNGENEVTARAFRILGHVYVQVLIGIVAGLAFGIVAPKLAVQTKPLADAFVKLIKMCVGPIVFLAVVHGINSAGNLRTAGRVGLKALLYFEIVTTSAMLIGWGVGEVLQPGAGLNVQLTDLDPAAIAGFAGSKVAAAKAGPAWLAFIPASLLEPFGHNDVIQLLIMLPCWRSRSRCRSSTPCLIRPCSGCSPSCA